MEITCLSCSPRNPGIQPYACQSWCSINIWRIHERLVQGPTAHERWRYRGRLHGGETLFSLFYLYNQEITLKWLVTIPFPRFPQWQMGVDETIVMATPALTLDSMKKPQVLLVSSSLAPQPVS